MAGQAGRSSENAPTALGYGIPQSLTRGRTDKGDATRAYADGAVLNVVSHSCASSIGGNN